MNKLPSLFFLSWLCFAVSAPVLHAQASLQAPCEIRNGAPRFLAKLAAGDDVRIGYLGGSITNQPGWRVQFRDWLSHRHPASHISEINAAIGGTGSSFGVFRVDADALGHRPDLLFVEFAVNDTGTPPEVIRRAMEGIVRKTRQQLPDCDIIFVYTLNFRTLRFIQNDRLSPPQTAMEQVARHYGIPSVQLGWEVARLEKAGQLLMRSAAAHDETSVTLASLDPQAEIPRDAEGRIPFANDGVHPYPDTGHVLYTRMLIRLFEQLASTASPSPVALPAPIQSDHWGDAKLIPLSDLAQGSLTGPWTEHETDTVPHLAKFSNRIPRVTALRPGATLRYTFRGTRLAFYNFPGFEGSELEINLNGEVTRVNHFDGYGANYRIAEFVVAPELPDAVHTVEITVHPYSYNKRELLHERFRHHYDAAPAKFEQSAWYVGGLMLVGELITTF
jgi:lysophospholipase L1-like esterase